MHRIRLRKGDILNCDFRKGNFDLFVSSLVLHNLGKKRFLAYDRLTSWMRDGSYVMVGDWFFELVTHVANKMLRILWYMLTQDTLYYERNERLYSSKLKRLEKIVTQVIG